MNRTDLEQNVLGAFFKNNEAIISCNLCVSDFSFKVHQEMFSKMLELYNKNGKIALSDFKKWDLVDKQVPDGMTPYEYVKDLAQGTFLLFGNDIINQSQMIKEIVLREELLYVLEDVISNIDEVKFSDVLSKISSIGEKDKQDSISAKNVYFNIISDLEKGECFYPCGINCIDKAMAGGFFKGFTYGFCGAEKAGKTTLAHTISYNLAKAGTKHLYIALEMGSKQIEQRNIARDLGVNSLKFLNDKEYLRNSIIKSKPRENLWYLDSPGATKQEIINAVAREKILHGIEGFIVDYWQLVQGKDSRETEEKFLRSVAQDIADFSRKNGLFCILLAQMNQDGKLFGGNGLRKACDQLYMIEQIENDNSVRWLRMDATRYTFMNNVGCEQFPSLRLNKSIGPYFEEII